MNPVRRRCLSLLCNVPVVAAALTAGMAPAPVSARAAFMTADRRWEPLDALPDLAEALQTLAASPGDHLAPARDEAASRSLGRLTKNLGKLHADIELLLQQYPDQFPSARQREQLDKLADDMIEGVYQVGTAIEGLLDDNLWTSERRMKECLREAAWALNYGRRSRAFHLSWVQRQLRWRSTDNTPWDAGAVRSLLAQSMAALDSARNSTRKLQAGLPG